MDMLFWSYIIVHGANVVATLYLIPISIKRYLETRINLLLLLTFIGIFWCLVNLNLILPILLGFSEFIINTAIHNMLFVPCIAMIILFYNSFEGAYSPLKVTFATSISLLTVILTIAGAMYDFAIVGTIFSTTYMVSFIWGPLIGFITAMGMVMAGVWGNMDLNKSMKNALNREQIDKIKKMRRGNNIMFFGGTAAAIPGYILALNGFLEISIWLAMVLAWIPSFIGFLSIGKVYISSPSFLHPEPVISLIVIHESGIPLLEYNFRSESDDMEVSLISGAITAVKALMAEAFNITSDIEKIVFKDRHILLSIREHTAFVLITGRISVYLQAALKQFANVFVKEFASKIREFDGNVTQFDSIIPELERAFGMK